MARPDKQGFPTWKPHWRSGLLEPKTVHWPAGSEHRKRFYKKLRNSSAAFISRVDVRLYVFERDNYSCVYCGKTDVLQVDHIVSVWACSMGKIPVADLNKEDNLQTLCIKCNAAKKP